MSREIEALKEALNRLLLDVSRREIKQDKVSEILGLLRNMRDLVSKCIKHDCGSEDARKLWEMVIDLGRGIYGDEFDNKFRMIMGDLIEVRENIWIETNDLSEMITKLKELEEIKRKLNLLEHKVITIVETNRKSLIQGKDRDLTNIMNEIRERLVEKGIILNEEDEEILRILVDKLIPKGG